MTMKTRTLAQIYELQGMKKEALDIYKEVLKRDPSNSEAKAAIRRLSGLHRRFEGVNEKKLRYFLHMKSDEEFRKFEAWLAAI